MSRPKGLPKTGGRQPNTPNKLTRDVREMVLGALAGVGGQDYLMRQAEENPQAFMTLVGKAMPAQVERGKPGEFAGLSDAQLAERVVASLTAKGVPEAAARAFLAEHSDDKSDRPDA